MRRNTVLQRHIEPLAKISHANSRNGVLIIGGGPPSPIREAGGGGQKGLPILKAGGGVVALGKSEGGNVVILHPSGKSVGGMFFRDVISKSPPFFEQILSPWGYIVGEIFFVEAWGDLHLCSDQSLNNFEIPQYSIFFDF